MRGMFAYTNFAYVDISGWNVSNVTNMSWMFANSSFNQDISGWDVSSVTNMSWMFANSPFNQNITGWDVLNVTECAVFHPGAKIIGWLPNFVNCND